MSNAPCATPEDAKNKLWPLLGFRLADRIAGIR